VVEIASTLVNYHLRLNGAYIVQQFLVYMPIYAHRNSSTLMPGHANLNLSMQYLVRTGIDEKAQQMVYLHIAKFSLIHRQFHQRSALTSQPEIMPN
jgi:CHASE1-domain containing sensor protein